MPFDLAIVQRLNRVTANGTVANQAAAAATLINTGNTNYIWNSYENDIQVDALQNLIMIEGTVKLAQEIMMILLTPIGTFAADPNYGTTLSTIIGSKLDSAVYAEIQTEVINALIHLNEINLDNPNSDEVIETIDVVRTVASIDDPRAISIQVKVTTESGKSVAVQVPQIQ